MGLPSRHRQCEGAIVEQLRFLFHLTKGALGAFGILWVSQQSELGMAVAFLALTITGYFIFHLKL